MEDFLFGLVGVVLETAFDLLPRPVREALCWACGGLLVTGFAIFALVSLFGAHS